MNIEEAKKVTVNRDVLSLIFKCEVRTITNFVTYGMPKDERGEYPFIDCLIWFIEKQQRELSDQSFSNPLNEAKVEAIKLNNEKKRIELEEKARKLLDADQVTIAFTTIMKMIGRNMEALAPRLMKQLGGDAKMLSTIRDEVNALRTMIAETSPEKVLDNYKNEFEDIDSEIN